MPARHASKSETSHFVGLDAGPLREFLRLLLVAGVICGDGQALSRKREADRLADAAGSAGDDCDSCHALSPLFFFGAL
jgi:hypothetical protein